MATRWHCRCGGGLFEVDGNINIKKCGTCRRTIETEEVKWRSHRGQHTDLEVLRVIDEGMTIDEVYEYQITMERRVKQKEIEEQKERLKGSVLRKIDRLGWWQFLRKKDLLNELENI